MSKTVKRKISVELQQKPSSKSRLSVFQRLGTKKSKSISDSKSLTDDFKQTLSAAVSIKPTLSISKPDVELDDADPDILEKKRQEIQKELELQMKMDSRRTGVIRKRKRVQSSSESSSSSSDSESSSSSSSSSSTDDRHRARKSKNKHRDSSSSSDEYTRKLAKKKRACQSKKEAMKLHKISKKHEIGAVSRKSKRHSTSPVPKKHRADGSSALLMSPSSQKAMKTMKVSATIDKHQRIRDKDVDRSELMQQKERERRLREERIHESPKIRRTSRTPKREFSRRTPPLRRSQSPKSRRSMSRRMESCERERRDKELVREKDRRDVLIRGTERPRERERIAKDAKGQRLLPRPAERAMALAAAQERNADKDHVPPYSSRPYADRSDTFDHRRHIKDSRDHDRPYENRREPGDYQHSGSYRRDWNDSTNKERDWHGENAPKEMYDRHRDWDRKRGEANRPPVESYTDRKDWSENNPKWESRKNSSWQQDSESGWNNRYKDDNWQDSNAPTSSSHLNRGIGEKSTEHGTPSTATKPLGGGIMRRWNTWRGRGRGGAHHSDFRRHQTEILEERGEIYRRHINPQAANATKPSTHKATEPQSQTAVEKSVEEPTKSSNQDEFAEEIADDLSEISDEADDILGQQEESQMKQQPIEKMDVTPIIEETETNHSAPALKKELNDSELEKDSKGEEKIQTPELNTSVKTPEEVDRSKELGDDLDLDFEEISDGELEEEARIKGLGDALGVDWASLVEESKAMLREKLTKTETTAKQRWNPNQILLDTGISYKMAGESFAQQTLINAFETVKKETQNLAIVKTEENSDEKHLNIDIKQEPNDDETKVNGKHNNDGHNNDALVESKEDEKVLILHPLSCVQTSVQSVDQKRRQLVFNASGPYSRGLCTKRDIAMRRQLCNLAVNETNCKMVSTKNGSGYESVAMKLFQKALQA